VLGKVKSCLRLIRALNSVMVGFAVIVGIAIAAEGDIGRVPLASLLSGFIVGFTISASSMILNDIADIEIDRINEPGRPLPSGAISLRTAWACYYACLIVGLSASITTGLDSFAVALAGAITGAVYDLRLKLSGLPGNIAVAFSTSLPLLYALTVVENANRSLAVFWGMVFLSVLAREIIKDIADVEGDRAKNARTLPIMHGARTASFAALLANIGAVCLSPIPLAYRMVRNPEGYALFILPVDAILLYASLLVVLRPSRVEALKAKKIMLIAMLLGLIGFLVGTLPG